MLGRTAVLSRLRQEVSYAAFTGDKNARAKLDRINQEAAMIGQEIESVEAAVREAGNRLVTARQDEASAASHAKAEQIAELNIKLKEHLDNADDAFSDGIESVLDAGKTLSELHSLGVASPTDALFRINAVIAVKTVLQQLPNNWINDFELLVCRRCKKSNSSRLP